MTIILKTCKWLIIIALLLLIVGFAYVRFNPVFGGKPDAESLKRIQASPHFNGEIFENLEPTEIATDSAHNSNLATFLASFFFPPAGKLPAEPLPSKKLAIEKLQDGAIAWFGHSTVLFQTSGKRFLLDPVFYRASPLPFGGNPFAQKQPTLPADFPPLDAVLISHDHYDHLDYRAIQELKDKTGHFYVPLGVKAHLQRWGIADTKITEMDWYETAALGDVNIMLAPARHFSGRNFNNRFTTLWGSWVVKSPGFSLFFNGDSGYGKHFAEIGERFGPFDVVLMENGAYNSSWAQIHMQPEQSVQAALDVRARMVLPIHWAKYDLALHEWREPIERFMAAAKNKPLQVATPHLGEVFDYRAPPQRDWWKTAK
ncbi:MBL fold metallo-hydrolase [Cardiobacterium hominis]|jgi:multidrug resistance protein romA|uniref:MBL fold metallo-hydrolase n=2 Tax=Cardiobacterium hominis TaxID=2718 RepID=UPI002491B55B|nr:MBL fold metallo-hydrolase [Cardiobacterium hominis]